jgi:RNA-binding protein NOB1
MVLSYSAAAKPAEDTPSVISIASAPESGTIATTTPAPAAETQPTASSSSAVSGESTQHLILDAGPLVSLTPLRHLAQAFHTTPMVVAELRDPKSREHWKRLGLMGVDVKVEMPKPEVMARGMFFRYVGYLGNDADFQVVAFAKKTGDYAVLSQTDLSVIALTCQYELEVNGDKNVRSQPGEKKASSNTANNAKPSAKGKGKEKAIQEEQAHEVTANEPVEQETSDVVAEEVDEEDEEEEDSQDTEEVEKVTEALEQTTITDSPPSPTKAPVSDKHELEDSDGGEWITPSNVAKHRSRDLGHVPAGAGHDESPLAAACMTGDYAVQNVLLSMGLGLVGEQGKRINKVKSWILRCHACFKTCRDLDKRFCPSCGNATLLRTTVSTSSKTGKQTVHLKKNFQYALRGTKFTIPDAKAGRAKGQQKPGNGLIMREDQREWQDAVRSEDIRRQKEERNLAKGALKGWDNPDVSLYRAQ